MSSTHISSWELNQCRPPAVMSEETQDSGLRKYLNVQNFKSVFMCGWVHREMHGKADLRACRTCVKVLTPSLFACLEICLLSIAGAQGEVLHGAVRTSQTESKTVGISSATPINPMDGKTRPASLAVLHSTEPKRKKIERFQPLMDISHLVKPAG